jgi:hypothetical protein
MSDTLSQLARAMLKGEKTLTQRGCHQFEEMSKIGE